MAEQLLTVQSVRFSLTESPRSVRRGRGWDPASAARWLRANGYLVTQPRPTPGQLRYRQAEPWTFLPETFRTVTDGLPAGVQVVEASHDPLGAVVASD